MAFTIALLAVLSSETFLRKFQTLCLLCTFEKLSQLFQDTWELFALFFLPEPWVDLHQVQLVNFQIFHTCPEAYATAWNPGQVGNRIGGNQVDALDCWAHFRAPKKSQCSLVGSWTWEVGVHSVDFLEPRKKVIFRESYMKKKGTFFTSSSLSCSAWVHWSRKENSSQLSCKIRWFESNRCHS